MPYVVAERDTQYCVYKQGEDGGPVGESLGCHETKAEAVDHLRALYAVGYSRSITLGVGLSKSVSAAIDPANDENLIPWHIDTMMMLNHETSDRRKMRSIARFRDFPLPLMAQTVNAEGHDGAVLVGRVDWAEVNGDLVPARGYIDTSTEAGAQAVRMVEAGLLTGVSVDIGSCTYEAVGGPWTGDHTGGLLEMGDLEITGLTLTPFPAFAETRGAVIDKKETAQIEPEPVTAAAPLKPPVEWFYDPGLSGRTRLTVTEDGRVFGHLAPWGECHIGIAGQCVRAPRSKTNYGWFALGTIQCEEGCQIPIGSITMDTGHAASNLKARAAAAHYDNTGTVVADVAVGEDDYGIWVAGAMRSTATPEQYRALGASRLSGDWRNINGNLELVAALAVNVGGFPVYEEAVAADGSPQTVIAALNTAETDEFVTTAEANLPLTDREREWDSEAAEARVRAWAGGDDIDYTKYGRAFFWHAPDPSSLGDFKLQFADIVNDQLEAVPRGIFAAAAALAGSRGGVDIPAADRDDVRSAINGYYQDMAAKFEDPTIESPVASITADGSYFEVVQQAVEGLLEIAAQLSYLLEAEPMPDEEVPATEDTAAPDEAATVASAPAASLESAFKPYLKTLSKRIHGPAIERLSKRITN